MKKFLSIIVAGCFAFVLMLFQTVQAESANSIQLIRNATLKINYAGKTILVDPMLSNIGEIESWGNSHRNPTKSLLIPISDIVKDVDFILVTHTHEDHFDPRANKELNKDIKIYYQPYDAEYFKKSKFTNAEVIKDSVKVGDITIHRVHAQHGSGETLKLMGDVSGYILTAPNEPTIYIVGDSIMNDEIVKYMEKYKPDYIVTNSGGAVPITTKISDGRIIMDEFQTVDLTKKSPANSTVIAVHLESIDHCYATRKFLRELADRYGISRTKLLIPLDTEIIPLRK